MRKILLLSVSISILLFVFLLFSCQTTEPRTIKTSIVKPKGRSEKSPEVSIEKERPRFKGGRIPINREIPLTSMVAIERVLSSLSLEQKVGQLFISWIPGSFVTKRAEKLIREGYIGGVILNKVNIKSRDQIKAFVFRLQQIAQENKPPIKLFVSADQEGGRVARFRFKEFTKFPAAYYWGEHNDPYFVEAVAYITGKELLSIGCNMDFAPVLDLYGRPDSTVIGDRSMGNNRDAVALYGRYYIFGAHEAGLIPVIKHFPGHGISSIDSHKKLPVVNIGEEELFARDVIPFKRAIDSGAEVVMTAHILYKKIDPDNPVTLSQKIIRGILREKLKFNGVVVSDAIEMGALTENNNIEEILLKALVAGVDIILVNSKYDVLELEHTVVRFCKEGKIDEKVIDESVKRILMLKFKYGLISPSVVEENSEEEGKNEN